MKRIRAFYFSPTGTTEKVIDYFTKKLAYNLGVSHMIQSYTLPKERRDNFLFAPDELLIWGTPVYAGRIPNKTLDFVKTAIQGQKTLSIPVVVYGNRSFDNALSELTGIMEDNGCIPIAAAAVAARHAFSDVLAKDRPDEADYSVLHDLAVFAADKIKKIEAGEMISSVVVPGQRHPEKYYVPLKEDGRPAKFLKVKPHVVMEKCMGCGRCMRVCPMGSIAMAEVGARALPDFYGICIKCQACVRNCTCGAISFEDTEFLSHKRMLEENYAHVRNESRVFW